MSTRWTDKMAILQDLAYAQGSAVPVDIKNPLSYNEKPPREVNEEETQEEFYKECIANGDYSNGPDIEMIQDLLEVVRNVNTSPDITESTDTIEISKLNMNGLAFFTPGPSGDHNAGPETIQEPTEMPKKKRNRNAAMVSLIEAYGEKNDTNSNEDTSLKLLRPTDFMTNEEASSQKVMLNSAESRLLSPASMFRKKTVPADGVSMFEKKVKPPVQSEVANGATTQVFVPSSMAKEYYEKYIERSKTNQSRNEDMWTRAGRIMMEIDEKRKRERESDPSVINTEALECEGDGTSSNVSV